jgi:conjugative transfer region protein TrbK
MKPKKLDGLLAITVVVLTVLVIAACTIRLRGEDNQPAAATSLNQSSDPMAEALEQCLSVVADQPEALTECRKVWAEKRREFLDKASPTSPARRPTLPSSPLFVPPNDQSEFKHGPSGQDSDPQPGKE